MSEVKYILQFMNYRPCVYSGFDKFSIRLALDLRSRGIETIFVYCDHLQAAMPLADELSKNNFRVELLQTRRGHLLVFNQIWQIFSKYRPALAHMHFDNVIKFMVALIAAVRKVSLTQTIHTQISVHEPTSFLKNKGRLKYWIFKTYHRLLASLSDETITVSNLVQRQFERYLGPIGNIQTLYLGVAPPKQKLDREVARKLMQMPTDKILIGNVSAITSEKGLDILVEGLSELKHRYGFADFVFYHIGGLRDGRATDPYLESLQDEIIKKDLVDHFCWLGVRHDVINVLPAFDIYIQPSRLEGLPVSLMEACSVGLPCVGTAVCGTPEIIHHTENGFLIEGESSQQLADSLHQLVEDDALRKRMGEASFKVFQTHFDLNTQVEKTMDIYLQQLKLN